MGPNGTHQRGDRGTACGSPSGSRARMPAASNYRFTLEDEKTWARTLDRRNAVREDGLCEGPFFEHACHEGNRAPTNMLGVARYPGEGRRRMRPRRRAPN